MSPPRPPTRERARNGIEGWGTRSCGRRTGASSPSESSHSSSCPPWDSSSSEHNPKPSRTSCRSTSWARPTYLGPADKTALRDFKPSAASLQYHLRRFVSDTREISSDVAVLKRDWLDAYKLVTPNAANQLNAYVRESDPFKQIEAQVRVSIQVNVVVPVSRETWQVEWTETNWDDHGSPTGTSTWRGNFRILLRVPDSEEELASNPLGLFIDEFHWARLSDAGRTTTP